MLRRLLSDNAMLATQYAAASLVPLLLIPHFVRTLGPESFGVIAMTSAVMGYASVIVQYAFALTGPAELAQGEGGRTAREVFLDVLVARLLLLAPIVTFAAVAVWHLPTPHRDVAAVLIALPVAAAINTGWYLQASGRLPVLVAMALVGTTVSLAIGFAVFPESTRLLWAAAALSLGPLAFAAGSLGWALVTLPAERGTPSLARAIAALHRGRDVFVSQFAAALYSMAGPLVVGALGGVRAAGLYGAIERVSNAVQAGLTLTHTAAYPRLARLFADPDGVRGYLQLVRYVLLLYAGAVVGIGILMLLCSKAIQRFLFGTASEETALLLWLAFAWIALGIFGPLVTGYWTASGQRHRILRLTWEVLLVSFPCGLAGAAFLGGAGWLLALIAGQCLVVWHAVIAYREISSQARRAGTV